MDGEALATLVVNRLRGTFQVAAVKAPGFGDRRKEMLKDIAILTGGQKISAEVGLKLENATLENLGTAKKVVITKESTTIIEGAGKAADVQHRIGQLKAEIERRLKEVCDKFGDERRTELTQIDEPKESTKKEKIEVSSTNSYFNQI